MPSSMRPRSRPARIDKTFLLAMAKDDGASKTSDIVKRMGVKPDYANMYRVRLIERDSFQLPARARYGGLPQAFVQPPQS